MAHFSLLRRAGHITSFFLGEEIDFIRRAAGGKLLVGMGFCQKPLSECPSGRFNHDCLYFSFKPSWRDIPSPCQGCAIRLFGELALGAGGTLYIMTSALDIAKDVLIPASDGEFTQAIFCVCPYSMEPIALSALMCGLEGVAIGYAEGACTDYGQWLRADRGIKEERTFLSEESYALLENILTAVALARQETGFPSPSRFKREGNIYRPIP
ncbi:MAG: hypothetical protein ACUVV0_08150 [Anaerolineae bacterium]